MDDVHFIDTTLRDGQQSLWALNMSTEAMLPTLPLLDRAGFESLEFWLPSQQVRKMVLELHENPWDWLLVGAPQMKNTQLQLHGRGMGNWSRIPAVLGDFIVERSIEHGLTLCRSSNNWNNYDRLEDDLARSKKKGLTVYPNIVYSVSPRHTDEYFVERARRLAKIRPVRVCFKDVGGLLTPEVTRRLVPQLLEALGDIDLELHGHGNNGLAVLNYIEAAKAGVRHFHTAVPPLANGSSQPSIFNVAKNMREFGFNPVIDESVLTPVTEHLRVVARRRNLAVGAQPEYDHSLYHHQVPGGMISNLRFQLRQIGREADLPAVLEEIGVVRADFGYPIMVTPLSQIVGTQAAVNVIQGNRYEVLTDQSIEYAMGKYGGSEATEAMDPATRARILGHWRAAELQAREERPEPTLGELRHTYGENVSIEELLVRVVADDPQGGVQLRRYSDNVRLLGRDGFADLIEELLENGPRSFSLAGRGMSVKIHRAKHSN